MSRFVLCLMLLLSLQVSASPVLVAQEAADSPLVKRFDGVATWFIPNTGACGDTNSESDYIVAMNLPQYGKGEPCHKSVLIKNKANGKTVTAKVTDQCPGCAWGYLDLSPSVFKALGDLDAGVLPITWQWA